ncbi:type II toxin-antitoxin system HicB family antitoxin [Desulfovibrio sp.]|uniref:type II toxin-antitoxin system HicB family antitoxin n=1 Tax=Desulfovibrio sp. TaxID=885 RepID=UPI003AAF1EA1
MKNVLEFEGGYQAVITYDPEIEMFRGEFVGLNGGADFYVKDAESLKREGKTSLDVFLRMCAEDGVQPKKTQGKFALRLPPDVYHSAAVAAAAEGKSLNTFITDAVRQAVAGA